MRRLPAVVVTVALAAGLLTLPVAELPVSAAASPVPVAPRITSLPLAGVDAAAARDLVSGPAVSGGGSAEDAAPAGAGVPRDAVLTAETPIPATDVLGISWTGTAEAGTRVTVRVRERGRWTGWQELGVTEHAPDPGSAEAARARQIVDPLVTAAADGVQVRIQTPSGRAPRDATLVAVDSPPAPADAATTPSPLSTARAAAAKPTIITRAQWGADESRRNGGPYYSDTIKVGFVHHTTGRSTYDEAGAFQFVRALYDYYTTPSSQGGPGYSDLAYNFLVDRFGRLFEGRAGGMDKPVIGGHTAGFNRETFAVSALGDFEINDLTPQLVPRNPAGVPTMVDSIARLLAWKLGLHGRDPMGTDRLVSNFGGGTSRYQPGEVATTRVIAGHGDIGDTELPGQEPARVPAADPHPGHLLRGGRRAAGQARVRHADMDHADPGVGVVGRHRRARHDDASADVDRGDPLDLPGRPGADPHRDAAIRGDAVDPVEPQGLRRPLGDAGDVPGHPVGQGVERRRPAGGLHRVGGTDGPLAVRAVPAGEPVHRLGPVRVVGRRRAHHEPPRPGGRARAWHRRRTAVRAAGGSVRAAKGAPLLLTSGTSLSPSVAADLRARRVTTVYVVGPTSAIPVAMDRALSRLGYRVGRIGGADAYAVSAALAVAMGPNPSRSAVVVSAFGNGWAEAATAAGPAARLGRPLLLVRRDSVPAPVIAALRRLGVRSTIVAAGPRAVSDAVVRALPRAVRVGDADLTKSQLRQLAVWSGPVPLGDVALAGAGTAGRVSAVVSATLGRPVLPVGADGLPAPVAAWLATRADRRRAWLSAPAASVPDSTVAVLNRLFARVTTPDTADGDGAGSGRGASAPVGGVAAAAGAAAPAAPAPAPTVPSRPPPPLRRRPRRRPRRPRSRCPGPAGGTGSGCRRPVRYGQALEGRTAEQILAHYYTGTRVAPVRDDIPLRVNLIHRATTASFRVEPLGDERAMSRPAAVAPGGRARAAVYIDGRLVRLAGPGEVIGLRAEPGRVRVTRTVGRTARLLGVGTVVAVRWSGTRAAGRSGPEPSMLNVVRGGESFRSSGHRYRYGVIDVRPHPSRDGVRGGQHRAAARRVPLRHRRGPRRVAGRGAAGPGRGRSIVRAGEVRPRRGQARLLVPRRRRARRAVLRPDVRGVGQGGRFVGRQVACRRRRHPRRAQPGARGALPGHRRPGLLRRRHRWAHPEQRGRLGRHPAAVGAVGRRPLEHRPAAQPGVRALAAGPEPVGGRRGVRPAERRVGVGHRTVRQRRCEAGRRPQQHRGSARRSPGSGCAADSACPRRT